MKFIRMALKGEEGERDRVLNPGTLGAMAQNGLGDMKIKMLPDVIQELSNDAEFFPGMPKSWSYTFMINDEDAPTGRPAGEFGWAGLPNLFYRIGCKNGLGGFWATQISRSLIRSRSEATWSSRQRSTKVLSQRSQPEYSFEPIRQIPGSVLVIWDGSLRSSLRGGQSDVRCLPASALD